MTEEIKEDWKDYILIYNPPKPPKVQQITFYLDKLYCLPEQKAEYHFWYENQEVVFSAEELFNVLKGLKDGIKKPSEEG